MIRRLALPVSCFAIVFYFLDRIAAGFMLSPELAGETPRSPWVAILALLGGLAVMAAVILLVWSSMVAGLREDSERGGRD